FVLSTPGTAVAGTAFSFTVTAQDAFNNTAAGYTGTVHFTSTDGAASLPTNSPLTNGVGSFTATLRTAGSQPITSTDTAAGTTAGDIAPLSLHAALPIYFVLSTPGTAVAGTAFSFTVTAQDAFNNTAPSYAGTVHFTSTDGAASLPADSPLTNGVGSFSATL